MFFDDQGRLPSTDFGDEAPIQVLAPAHRIKPAAKKACVAFYNENELVYSFFSRARKLKPFT